MKKSLVVAIWLIPAVALAEPERAAVTLRAGASAATLSHDLRVHRYGLSGGLGAYLQWPLIGKVSLGGQLDVLYTPRGADVVVDGESQGKLREHYLDIVAAARPQVRVGVMSLYLLIGGGVNRLLKATDESSLGVSQDVTDNLRRTDLELLFGAGVSFDLSSRPRGLLRSSKFFLEARYDIGLIDIDPMDGGFRNRTATLSLGLSLGLLSGKSLSSVGPVQP